MYSDNSIEVTYYRGDDGQLHKVITTGTSTSTTIEYKIKPDAKIGVPKSFMPRSFFCFERRNRVYVICERYLVDATQTLNIFEDISNFDRSKYLTQVYSIEELKDVYKNYKGSAIPGHFGCFLLKKKRPRKIIL